MFGFTFIKFQPNEYVLKYRNGRVVREGAGLSFFYYIPTTALAAVPLASTEAPFIFEEVTADYQTVTVQGQVTYRIADPKKIASLLNFGIDPEAKTYLSEDPENLAQRVLNVLKVYVRGQLEGQPLKNAIQSSRQLAEFLQNEARGNAELKSMGLEVLGLSILAVRPNAETARALEAGTREQILKEADDAIYIRRNAAVEQERIIKENELNTEIAVENKIRQKKEAQMEAERVVQEKRQELKESETRFAIAQEEKRREFVKLAAENARVSADAKSYEIAASMKALEGVAPAVIQALASMGMQPEKIIALAFQGLAEKAGEIGQLNISPDLLRELLHTKSSAE